MVVAAVVAAAAGCTTDLDCSLNGLCSQQQSSSSSSSPVETEAEMACVCDVPWIGERCQTMDLQPGEAGLHDIPLCAYHGDGPNSTSWGGSVLHSPEDGKYYMWAASMINNCTMDDWTTNSEVVLAKASTPLGPFSKVKTIVLPWAHNPQTIRAPDNSSASGHVYAVYTMGDGLNYHGQPKNCGGAPPPPPRPTGPPGVPWNQTKDCPKTAPYQPANKFPKCMLDTVINFTIFHSETADGEYERHTAVILGWPAHSHGRPWEYGAFGNWNPAPLVHPNGTIYLLAHSEQFGFKHGEAMLTADSWRGPYRFIGSDTDSRWGGSTNNAEDPYMWIDKRGNWHQLVEGNPMPGGHAWSADGITWSNMSGCNGAYALDGCFNLTRPYKAANGSLLNISYYTERPKLLLAADRTPTHLYGTVYWPIPNEKGKSGGFTIVEPLGKAASGSQGRMVV